jgi:peptidylprolyl isomerase
MVLEFDVEEAPLTAQVVLGFAEAGSYDGTPFHRVVPGFVTQGGDFARGDGRGGPGFYIGTETTLIPFGEGVVGMANAGPNTEGSQFFLVHRRQPGLDGRYTAFARIIEGLEVLQDLQEGDVILSAEIQSG